MPGILRASAAGVVVAAVLAVCPVGAAQAEGGFAPVVLAVGDVTGDGVADLVAGQARTADPGEGLVRVVDGARGAVLWEEVVPRLIQTERVALAGGGAFVVANHVTDGSADTNGLSVRLRAISADGAILWDRTFTASALVPSPVPSYIRPSLRGVLRRSGQADALLVESNLRVEAAAGRVTRTTAYVLDAGTGETVAEHGPIDTTDDDVELVAAPDVTGDGTGDFGALTYEVPGVRVGPGTLRMFDAVSGTLRWTADVRSDSRTEVMPLLAGDPPSPALSVTSFGDSGGLQLLDPETGTLVVDRPRGDYGLLADGTGAARRIRTRYFSEPGTDNGYTVELVDLTGSVVASRFFRVGDASEFGTRSSSMGEAGDVDGDGWLDLLVHVWFRTGGTTAYDDRLVDGRTLTSVEVDRAVETLVWTGPGSAAVDGNGDDMYTMSGRSARVLDGRSRRPLLEITTRDTVGALLGVRDGSARCADVVVATYGGDDFALTRLAPRGAVRWSTAVGRVTARDVAGHAGCSVVEPRRAEREPTIPATGGGATAPVAVLLMAAAIAVRRQAVLR